MPMSKRPASSASMLIDQGWPTRASGGLRHALALREASGEAAGRHLSRRAFDTGAVCPVPGLFSSSLVAAGFTLGFWRGLAAVYPAAVLGAVLSFAAGRRLGARWRAYIPTKVATLCEAIGDGGFFMLLLLRLTPLTVCASSAFLGRASEAPRTASRPRCRAPPSPTAPLTTCLVLRCRSVPTISARAHAAATAVGFLRLSLHVHIGTSLRHFATATGGSEIERWASVGGAVVAAIAVGNVARLMLQKAAKIKSI